MNKIKMSASSSLQPRSIEDTKGLKEKQHAYRTEPRKVVRRKVREGFRDPSKTGLNMYGTWDENGKVEWKVHSRTTKEERIQMMHAEERAVADALELAKADGFNMKMSSKTCLTTNGVSTFRRDTLLEAGEEEGNVNIVFSRWLITKANILWEVFGDRLLGIQVHMDEKNPGIHYSLLNKWGELHTQAPNKEWELRIRASMEKAKLKFDEGKMSKERYDDKMISFEKSLDRAVNGFEAPTKMSRQLISPEFLSAFAELNSQRLQDALPGYNWGVLDKGELEQQRMALLGTTENLSIKEFIKKGSDTLDKKLNEAKDAENSRAKRWAEEERAHKDKLEASTKKMKLEAKARIDGDMSNQIKKQRKMVGEKMLEDMRDIRTQSIKEWEKIITNADDAKRLDAKKRAIEILKRDGEIEKANILAADLIRLDDITAANNSKAKANKDKADKRQNELRNRGGRGYPRGY